MMPHTNLLTLFPNLHQYQLTLLLRAAHFLHDKDIKTFLVFLD